MIIMESIDKLIIRYYAYKCCGKISFLEKFSGKLCNYINKTELLRICKEIEENRSVNIRTSDALESSEGILKGLKECYALFKCNKIIFGRSTMPQCVIIDDLIDTELTEEICLNYIKKAEEKKADIVERNNKAKDIRDKLNVRTQSKEELAKQYEEIEKLEKYTFKL